MFKVELIGLHVIADINIRAAIAIDIAYADAGTPGAFLLVMPGFCA
jgi:hypothetical protein